ncbi:0bbc4d6a-1134-4cab-9f75-326520e0370e [Thermothielavioides terrestris]|uniref:0bbc4d6a-1134-4cab-9f75-326520e0370e n=1 Tax=Thermothielavioides terrestris TaxID=2587410 RepID=A0A446BW33_9PEZI|nr:0bbc4d6a-1134-4cab-9f75-326520e0370e [Thermothielavioides terrestris]
MRRRADDESPQRTCKLVPPCKQVNHGLSTGKIGKYCFTEETLKHDIAALKRGEIYERNDFFLRAKAWYKAEIDRLIHLETVKGEAAQLKTGDINSTTLKPGPQLQTTARRNKTPARAPSRIQPDRAVKRKVAEYTAPKRPPPRKKKGPLLIPVQGTGSVESAQEPETKGDYVLAPDDWARFVSGNREEHDRSPWSYIQFQGLDVAYFCMRLERALQEKVEEIASRINIQESPEPEEESKVCDGIFLPSKSDAAASQSAPPQFQAHPRPRLNFRCALGHDYPRPAPFSPKAALAPGEDWRPPANTRGNKIDAVKTTTTPPPTPTLDTTTTTTTNNSGSLPPITSWAAAEVRRREELTKRAAAAWQTSSPPSAAAPTTSTKQAPEAEMEISPSLGRWRAPHTRRAPGSGWGLAEGSGAVEGGEDGSGSLLLLRLPVEDLARNVVEDLRHVGEDGYVLHHNGDVQLGPPPPN